MAKPNETFTLQNISRQRWAATADGNGTFTPEMMNLSIQLRIAEALETSVGLLKSMETRLTAAEKENTTLRNSVARLRKEVRNA